MIAATLVLFLAAQSGADASEPLLQEPMIAAPAAPTETLLRAPAGTPLEIELVEALSSDSASIGQRFAIRLAEPITVDGVTLVPAGAQGEGEVIDAAGAGISGRQGKLIVAARHLDLGGRQVRIRGMTLMGAGSSRVGLATGIALTPYAGPVALLIRGGEIEMPAGLRATARLAEDLTLPPVSATQEQGT